MTNRKNLYGYRIRDGVLEIVPEEQQTVYRIFTLYQAGASYQKISDALNQSGVPYCTEAPLWNKHKIKRLLENSRYTGRDGYPVIVSPEVFQNAQQKTAEKNANRCSPQPKSILSRLTPYFSCTCGQKLTRFGGRWLEKDRLHLKCGACGCTTSTDADQAVKEIVRQFYAHGQAGQTCYVPSAEVIRLNNAINRGLEHPDEPEAVAALILQGAAARYQCCPDVTREISSHPSQIDWRYFHRVVSCIIVSPENTLTVKFQDEAVTGKE